MSGYTRDQPIWWQHRNNDPLKALFVAYRAKQVIIDVVSDDKSKRRKHVYLTEIQPREEIQKNEGLQEEY